MAAVAAIVHGSSFSLLARGSLRPLAVARSLSQFFVIASGHGGGRCLAAGEPGVSCGRMWGRFLFPTLPLSLKCGCSVSSLLGSAAFSFSSVSSWSGHSLGLLRLLLHRERGLGCALRLLMEIQPLGCCFDGCVLRLRLLVASVAGSPAGGRDGAFPDARSGCSLLVH